MKIFWVNISVERKSQAPVTKGATEYALSSGWWPDDAATGTVLSNAYQQVVWVYRAIGALAEQVSNIPFRFSSKSDDGEQLITRGFRISSFGFVSSFPLALRPSHRYNGLRWWTSPLDTPRANFESVKKTNTNKDKL